ncbi:hypothetical protein DXG03_000073 [Asterophora parasitica]|uniref:Cytochrome c oxidase assembly factor 3 n=1 Tax=Asterophora parasitica TaxID=117018 RepID=A0A9P7GEY7_9AGAR|nr:hypothetical protein DXG03_000073 [Asterophora parasitica]
MSQNSQYIDPKIARDSYRPRAGLMSPGLKRAREPYRVRNAVTGVLLGACAIGIWAYSISAVKQDVFDDVDEEARAMARSGTVNEVLSVKEEKKVMDAAIAAAVSGVEFTQVNATPAVSAPGNAPSRTPTTNLTRGILQHLDGGFPRLLDPQRKTWVWGAPPVDNIGKIAETQR